MAKKKKTTKKGSSNKTGKPSSCKVTRSGKKFTCEWKQASGGYGAGQELKYRLKTHKGRNGSHTWGPWHTGKVTSGATKYVIPGISTLLNTKYLDYIQFKVRGQRKATSKARYSMSDWNYGEMDISAPAKPTIKVDRSLAREKTKFSWKVKDGDKTDGNTPFKGVYLYTYLRNNNEETTSVPRSKFEPTPKKYSKLFEGSETITETTVDFSNKDYSYTRFYMVEVEGFSGFKSSKVATEGRQFSLANNPTVDDVDVTDDDTGNITISIKWTPTWSFGHNISDTNVEYTVCVPDFSSSDTVPVPTNASWKKLDSKSVGSVDKATGSRYLTIHLDSGIPVDNAIFVRAYSSHDDQQVYSAIRFVNEKVGKLKSPTISSVNAYADKDNNKYRVTVNATNNSEVGGSHLVVTAIYTSQSGEVTRYEVGDIKNGSSSGTFECPDWSSYSSYSFEVMAVAGKNESGEYIMTSETTSEGGEIPQKATGVTATCVSTADSKAKVLVTWEWNWDAAQYAEVSWSDDPDAWESTTSPNTFMSSSLRPTRCYIPNLDTGKTWYIRVRYYFVGSGSNNSSNTYGEYSDVVSISLKTAPVRPALTLSSSGVSSAGFVTATWAYTSTDGTAQKAAEIYEYNQSTKTYTLLFRTDSTIQHYDISGADLIDRGWNVGEAHQLVVSVLSGSGVYNSDRYSLPVQLSLVEPPTVSISNLSSVFQDETDTDDEGTVTTRKILTDLPMSFTVTASDQVDKVSIFIERTISCHLERPSGVSFDGFAGEVEYTQSIAGSGDVSIDVGDLIRPLDDGSEYRIRVLAQDKYDQTVDAVQNFTVRWAQRALVPSVEIAIDDKHSVARITPLKITGGADTDRYDVYRLSLDAPELILQDGIPGNVYYDPYPTLGESGGYRVVYKTRTGNYITKDNVIAWLDTTDFDDVEIVDQFAIIIDYANEQVVLPYDIEIDNSWSKDFTETKYLGGAVQGDWNLAVERSTTLTTDLQSIVDLETIRKLRDLANYAGICHVRTPDGSSFAADVQVSEKRENKMVNKLASFTLTVKRVDSEGLDAITAEQWKNRVLEMEIVEEFNPGVVVNGGTDTIVTVADMLNAINVNKTAIEQNTTDVAKLKDSKVDKADMVAWTEEEIDDASK